MYTSRKIGAALTAATIATSGVLLAQVAESGSAGAAPSASDATFVTANEQSNLAEISLGQLAGAKGQDSATKDLASTTLTDHMTAKSKLTDAAGTAGATLPQAPNTMQLTVASQLRAAPSSSFDLMYAQAQVSAHQQALAGAKLEQSTTKVAALKSYTSFYIGIATMHLRMAQDEVTALGGPPSSVPAGSGGAAATNSSSEIRPVLGIGAGAVLILAGLGIGVRRRRTVSA